ncbi:ppsA [Symbiodinium sp. CCMP2592]|nr:ppsA [Symbiodinium sp. CCMP2592]
MEALRRKVGPESRTSNSAQVTSKKFPEVPSLRDACEFAISFKAYAQLSNWRFAACLLARMPELRVDPDPVCFRTVADGCAKVSVWTSSLATLGFMEASGSGGSGSVSEDQASAKSAMRVWRASGHWSQVQQLLAELCQTFLQLDVRACNTALDAAGASSQWKEARLLLQSLKKYGLEPSRVSYNSLCRALAKGKGLWQRAICDMEKSRSECLRMDVIGLNTLLASFSDLGLWSRSLQELTRAGATTDRVSYNSAASAAIQRSSGWATAVQLLSTINRSALRPDAFTVNFLIRAYSESSWSSAFSALELVAETQLRPASMTYVAALHACRTDPSWSAALLLVERCAWKPLDDAGLSQARRALDRTGSWRQALLRTGRRWQLAMVSLESRQDYNEAIMACEERWEAAIGLVKALKAHLVPDLVSYNALLATTRWLWCIEILSQIRPDVVSFTAAINSCDSLAWNQSVTLLSRISGMLLRLDTVSCNAGLMLGFEQRDCMWFLVCMDWLNLDAANADGQFIGDGVARLHTGEKGYDLPSLQKSSKNIGVFVGVSGSEWGTVPHKMDAAGCGSAEAIISNRVNFALNLKGASRSNDQHRVLLRPGSRGPCVRDRLAFLCIMPCIIFHERVDRTSVFGISAVSACLASYISYVRTEHVSFAPTPTRGKLSLQTTAMADDENPDDGPGLIKLDMKQFGSGTMEDPLRHAVGMRTAQDQYKMQMWNSFPSLFQNTIFHGEQDAEIQRLRKSGSLDEKLQRAKQLKEEGNKLLKSSTTRRTSDDEARKEREAQQELEEQLEAQIWEKEKELKDLRQQLAALRATAERNASNEEVEEEDDEQEQLSLDAAVRSYEKAAGLLRYVECVRQDWKNDDGSYKGIEDDFLRVDETALEAAEASELVQSCYLNIALACQKLRKFDDMKRACDEVLEKVNPDSVKALYRRAQARLAPISAKDADREAAIQDLMAAARLAPNDKEVRNMLTKLRKEKKKQEMEDKSTFGGLFQRGEVVKNDYKSEPPRPAAPAKWDLNDPKATHTGKVHLKYKDFDPLDGAICCGTQLAYGPFGFVGCCSGGMLSFKGRCFTYDVSADGYLRGEGVSSIFLELKEFGREVFTLMPASQANQDGRSASITAPNGPSQERCIRACFREAKYQPAEVDCFETHGTGTALGDPIEVGAFKRIYAQSQRAHPLMVTSSKTNLGHLEGGAGMAGFIKCILQVMRCEASPNIHLRERNPHLDVEGFPTQFLSEGLVTHYNTAVTGVSSFGFGGTNAHAMPRPQHVSWCVIRTVSVASEGIRAKLCVASGPPGGPGGPGGGFPGRRKKGGASERATPILAEVGQTLTEAQDILDQARPEDLLDEVSPSEGSGSGLKAGPLAKKMWSCARRGVRSEEVWARFAQRVLMTGTLIGATDISLMFRAFARIKYRDARALDTLSPFILRHIDSFNTEELVLLLLAHKKLEYERTDNLHLLLNVLCQRKEEWTGKDVALISNAVAHFYIYRPRFWRLAAMSLNRLVWTMNPLELTILVSAMARVDRRDEQALIVIAKMCRRCAQRHLFSQETLATAMNAFAKLDFNNVKLAKAFEDAAVKKLDRALELGPQYRRSGSLRDQDVFDLQALVLLFRTLVALVGTSDDVAAKLLTLLAWSKDELGDYQRRVLKPTSVAFRRLHPALFKSLSMECRDALHTFETTQVKITTFESRWMREVRGTLRKMDVSVELKPIIDDQVLDIWLPVSKAVVCAVGPYGYYAGTTERTAYSKLHQRTLEMEGYVCMTVPYFEWADLKTEEDKMVYLWSLGRKSAGTGKKGQVSSEVSPAVELPLQSALPPDVFKHSLDPEEWETNGAPLSEDKIGKVYEVEVDASGAAVWREVVDTPPDPKAHKRFGLAGSFNGWSCTTMAELPGLPGLFAAEITVGESGVEYFHVLGDEDTSQVYYPAQPRSRRKVISKALQVVFVISKALQVVFVISKALQVVFVISKALQVVFVISKALQVVFVISKALQVVFVSVGFKKSPRLEGAGPGMAVTLIFEEKSVVFGWTEGTAAKEFGTQLRSAVQHLTGLSSLAELEILAEADPPVRITPRDIFERRYPDAAQHRFRIACRAELASDNSVPKGGAEASPGPGGYSPEPRAEKLLLPPQRKCPSGAKFQKAGGSQLQFLQMLEGNKNPKAQLEEGTVLTAEEVARHNQVGDCWTIFQGRVYDISAYIDFHPGGKKQIMQGAGKDMTSLFHKAHPWVSMEGLVGKLCLGPLVAKPMAKTQSQPTVAKATPSYYNAVTEALVDVKGPSPILGHPEEHAWCIQGRPGSRPFLMSSKLSELSQRRCSLNMALLHILQAA